MKRPDVSVRPFLWEAEISGTGMFMLEFLSKVFRGEY